ncbi:MAG: SiaB family protein kinase [Vicingus serpentipes]|nr:SiaB family protein kinase [Vicingus serpentipes]
MDSIHDFYEKMESGNIMLSFKGEVTSNLLTSVLQIMETKMENLSEPPKIKKKVYNILVECLQNLYHHMDEDDPDTIVNEKSALFMIKKSDEGEYSIMTGNYIGVENAEIMKSRLDKINEMDRDQLKTYYKEVLNNGEMSAKGGGGLGMIDIARKSGKKLEYNFDPIDDKVSFFSLNIKIAQ